MNALIMRLPTSVRDRDGVRIDVMLEAAGATVIRELPRKFPTHVDLLVEDTSAPEEVRGLVVVPIYDEVDGELSFDRWEEWTVPEVPAE
jgi:hypothetical protein